MPSAVSALGTIDNWLSPIHSVPVVPNCWWNVAPKGNSFNRISVINIFAASTVLLSSAPIWMRVCARRSSSHQKCRAMRISSALPCVFSHLPNATHTVKTRERVSWNYLQVKDKILVSLVREKERKTHWAALLHFSSQNDIVYTIASIFLNRMLKGKIKLFGNFGLINQFWLIEGKVITTNEYKKRKSIGNL